MTLLIGNMINLFAAISSPDAIGIPHVTIEEYHKEIRRISLNFVYIGVAVFFAGYVGTVCWILAGERISRRIRMYLQFKVLLISSNYLRAVLRQDVAFFDRVGAGEVTNHVSHDADMIQDGISEKVDT